MCTVIETAVQQAFVNFNKKVKIKDLDLGTISDDYKEYKAVLEVFMDETVDSTIYHLSNMKTAINTSVINEMRERKLESLKGLEPLTKLDTE